MKRCFTRAQSAPGWGSRDAAEERRKAHVALRWVTFGAWKLDGRQAAVAEGAQITCQMLVPDGKRFTDGHLAADRAHSRRGDRVESSVESHQVRHEIFDAETAEPAGRDGEWKSYPEGSRIHTRHSGRSREPRFAVHGTVLLRTTQCRVVGKRNRPALHLLSLVDDVCGSTIERYVQLAELGPLVSSVSIWRFRSSGPLGNACPSRSSRSDTYSSVVSSHVNPAECHCGSPCRLSPRLRERSQILCQ